MIILFPRQCADKSFATRLGIQAWQELVHRRPLIGKGLPSSGACSARCDAGSSSSIIPRSKVGNGASEPQVARPPECRLGSTAIHPGIVRKSAAVGRVGMWRGGGRLGMSVSAPFVWRCLSGSAIAPFPHPSHRTQRADFPHCALGQDFTPSSTACRVQAGSDARARRSRRGARVDSCRPCFVWSCA